MKVTHSFMPRCLEILPDRSVSFASFVPNFQGINTAHTASI